MSRPDPRIPAIADAVEELGKAVAGVAQLVDERSTSGPVNGDLLAAAQAGASAVRLARYALVNAQAGRG